MAYSKFQRDGREYSTDYDHDTFLQAIESYDIKTLVREAASQGILAVLERSEIERKNSRHSMRECLVNFILQRGVREQQQFARFVRDFSRRAYEQTCKQLSGLNRPRIVNATESNVDCFVHAGNSGKELPQLSQDSSHSSAGSTSPMELDSKPVESNIQYLVEGLSEDMGYFSISGSGSLSNDPMYAPDSCTAPNLTSYTSPSFMENELKKLQKTRGHRLQHFVSNSTKQQHSRVPAAFKFPSSATGELSQTIPSSTSIVHCHNYVTNVFNVSNSQTRSNSGSESPGVDMLDFPGSVSTSHSCAKSSAGRYSPFPPQQEKKWESDWSQCLKEHHCRIIEYLDVNTLLPHLWEKGLLTPNERDTLDSMHTTPRKQARYLLRLLPGKGKQGFKRFLECLRDEKYHLGHEDLLKCLDHSNCSQNL